jgi:ATP-dependent DNA helicase RecG
MSNTALVSADPLSASSQYAKGVGPARFELFKKMGLLTIEDLLFHFPRAYEDLSDCRRIADLTEDGTLQTAMGEIVELDSRTTRSGKTLISAVIHDGQDVLEGIWFNQAFICRQLRYGMKVAFSGKPQWQRDHWQMNKPRVRPLTGEESDPDDEALPRGRILPVYRLTEGLFAEQMRRILRYAAEQHAQAVPEALPPALRDRFKLPPIGEAIRLIHLPGSMEDVARARRRLVFEEFLVLNLALALKRRDQQPQAQSAPKLPITEKIDAHIRRLFPFQLTRDQNRAIAAICKDLAQERPMRRLLQADVGAGKTAVAVYAMLVTVAHKHQTVLMAPTEVLARQHWRTLNRYLSQSRVRRALLTGALPPTERKRVLGELRHGQLDLVVGTQALIQNDVEFARLGLVVIDEQHRFGVLQRAQVKQLGHDPHYLVMTATPIPRTIALTVFGDLDASIIRELPPGRQPVLTRWLPEEKRSKLHAHLEKELKKGRQCFVVCPLVEEGGVGDRKAAEQLFEEMKAGPLGGFRIGLLHGRLPDDQKDRVMAQFHARELDLLVTTTVVEVGVDVPNATLMVIEGAERFGLSQLHQLRGRVSRGTVRGECYVFASVAGDEAKDRLRLFARCTDGFELAEADLKLRGMGQFFGTRQHGLGELRVGSVVQDHALLETTRDLAREIVKADAHLKAPDHAGLRRLVLNRYGESLELAAIG